MSATAGLPDAAYATAIAGLRGVGPALLRGLLLDRPARWCFAELMAGRGEALLAPGLSRDEQAVRRRPPAGTLERLSAEARSVDVAGGWERLCRLGVGVARPGEAAYPPRLESDLEAPAVLFVSGAVPAATRPAVAVVGTRACTHYGEEVAAELAGALAGAGVVVVSGLAAGIDCAAHAGALAPGEAAAPPLGIVGGGVDVVYPASAGRIWRLVAERGAIVSEAPPGTAPEAWRFPERNRMLAAMSDVVVVVESHRRGGALHTVEAAARRGVPVGAVPGSVHSAASAGTNDLLADGAHVVREVADVLTLLALSRPMEPSPVGPSPGGPSPVGRRRVAGAAARTPAGRGGRRQLSRREPGDERQQRVLGVLEERPLGLGEVMQRSGLGLEASSWALEQLAASGLVARVGAGWERRC